MPPRLLPPIPFAPPHLIAPVRARHRLPVGIGAVAEVAIATQKIAAYFGFDTKLVAQAAYEWVFGETKNWRGLDRKSEQAQQFVENYNVAAHDSDLYDQQTVDEVCAAATAMGMPALATKIRNYWERVKKPRLEKEALAEAARASAATYNKPAAPAPARPVFTRAGSLALASKLADVSPVTPHVATAAAVAPAPTKPAVSTTTAVATAGGLGVLGLLALAFLRRG